MDNMSAAASKKSSQRLKPQDVSTLAALAYASSRHSEPLHWKKFIDALESDFAKQVARALLSQAPTPPSPDVEEVVADIRRWAKR